MQRRGDQVLRALTPRQTKYLHWWRTRLIPPQQSALMHEALQAVGATCELEWVEGAGHVLFGVDPDPIADRSADFLVRHLT